MVVEGFLFSSIQLVTLREAPDAFEGDVYQHGVTLATLTDGTMLEAHIYRLRQ